VVVQHGACEGKVNDGKSMKCQIPPINAIATRISAKHYSANICCSALALSLRERSRFSTLLAPIHCQFLADCLLISNKQCAVELPELFAEQQWLHLRPINRGARARKPAPKSPLPVRSSSIVQVESRAPLAPSQPPLLLSNLHIRLLPFCGQLVGAFRNGWFFQ